jgi:hypothetical protein
MAGLIYPAFALGQMLNFAQSGGKLRLAYERFTLAAEVAGSYPIATPLPAGAVPYGGFLLSSVSLGSSTIAIGISGTTGKYRAAATFTATDVPTLFGVSTALGTPLTAQEQLLMTVAAATLPGSGTLHIGMFYALNN